MTNPRTVPFSSGDSGLLDRLLCQLRFRRVAGMIRDRSNVLDVGCGYRGELLRTLSPRIASGRGIDVSVDDSVSAGNVELVGGDLSEGLPFPDATFDVVVSLANIEHLEDSESVVREIYRVLKPGGTLLLTTPTKKAKPVLEFLAYTLHVISEREIRDHKRYFSGDELGRICRDCGFSEWSYRTFQCGMNGFLVSKK
ncbi:MAG: class I SAM-dependent methyltransferase [Candidatus Moranbacteria bacterium]|nr:class I SAM-dependent methyltransferase [Candidatus Moranbacteria bacterium]NTW89680.1 class I SAM-dependent methyltransferase [Candidatus Moranbacteria bacterium]